ncbi:hypothetical protein AX15_000516 [Amanita polypyramis BW_CC]|nr:hypothetical protein AX15_000516 [Amanita polypyramis BW_CC]
MAIEASTGQLIGTFLETLGFGIYLVVGPQAFVILRRRKLRMGLAVYLYSTMIITFILITFHLAIDLTRAFIAFTAHTNIPYSPEIFYNDVNSTLTFVKNSTVVATTLVADILLIYRTSVLWKHRWWILILPVALYGLDVATSIWFTWSLKQGTYGSNLLYSSSIERSVYFCAATLAVNLVCTCLIAYRIWAAQKTAVARNTSVHHRVQNLLSIMFESAAIYTASLACMIILASIRSGFLFVFLNSMPPLIGLVFIFVTLGGSSEAGHYSSDVRRPALPNDTSPPEGARIHLEKVVYCDIEDEQEPHV